MSQERQQAPAARRSSKLAEVVTFEMPAGHVFDWHTHTDHQLAWAASGVLTVRTELSAWVLPPTRALFIPAGLRHETLSSGRATMRAVYLRPGRCAVQWVDCTPVTATPLLAEVIGYLEDEYLDATRRRHGESMLVDLLDPVEMTTIDVRMPTDERAIDVARALLDDPADSRTLGDWGRAFGASARTLERAFVADTGLPFGRWRGRLRLRVAMVELAQGEPVSRVAPRVGYESVSAFVAAFRKETGVTPATYFRQQRPGRTAGPD